MTERVVIRRSRGARSSNNDFRFTKEMIPELNGSWDGPTYVKDYRMKAWTAYEKMPVPVTTDEAWRRTDIKSLEKGSLLAGDSEWFNEANSLPPAQLMDPLVGDSHGGQIVIRPGNVITTLDSALASQGVIFKDLKSAERENPEILEKVMGKIVDVEEGKFAAMAGAFAQNGVLVYVPKGLVVEQPLHSVLWGPGNKKAYFSHILVYLESGASLTYVHEASSPSEEQGQAMHAGLVEVYVGDDAHLRFVELQSWGKHVWNFSHERAVVGRNGNLDWIFGAVGSHLTKNFSDLDLTGEGASGRMSGFYFTDGVQHLDHDTQQNHRAPHTTSDMLFKGALKERSRSVWQGMIYVAPGAQQTDGYQANRNLVLSESARADSIPGLEILADDVRCTHGATVGKIDPEQVFYLQSRGLPREAAERLVVEGFFDPIMQRIPFERVRQRFQTSILEKMA